MFLEPLGQVGCKSGNISIQIAGARDVNTLAGEFVADVISWQALWPQAMVLALLLAAAAWWFVRLRPGFADLL